jgi:iron-sulfur cluster repair protein YtfE (RIC family)
MNFISTFVEAEHARLDQLLNDFLAELKDINKASILFQQFNMQLLLHMKLEDDYLFPRLSEYLEMDTDSGLAQRARQDHLVIRRLVSFVEEACQLNELKKIVVSARNLQQSLIRHHAREKELQYPVSDHFIPREEWDLILIRVYGERNQEN